ncbi:MAG: glycosyltransferase family 2 protein [Bacteroidetes bacterium]|nr:glycosyltransferase family 2 protein [Bacteroidota bacterium]
MGKIVDIVIPTYNGLENLKMVLESVNSQSHMDFRIIVVDNASTDGSSDYIKKNYPNSVVITNPENYGFARAVNTGINYSLDIEDSEFVLLLNNDIELDKNFLAHGISSFDISECISSVAVKMMNFYSRGVIDDTGDFLKSNGGSPMPRGSEETDIGQYDKPEYIFSACAGAAFYRKSVFRNAGKFDEDFFAYLEDVDFGFRLQLYGYKCYYNPACICYHKRGDTSGKIKGLVVEYSEKNLIALRLKNYPLSIYMLHSPFFFAARLSRYFRFLFFYPKGVFASALKGYFKGLREIPSTLRKRNEIMKNRKVTTSYIIGMFK